MQTFKMLYTSLGFIAAKSGHSYLLQRKDGVWNMSLGCATALHFSIPCFWHFNVVAAGEKNECSIDQAVANGEKYLEPMKW